MKDKDILKALKCEVTSVMPNCLGELNKLTVARDSKVVQHKDNETKPYRSTKFIVAVACSMVLVFGLMVAMPFIINSRPGNSNSVQYSEPTSQTEQVSE